MRPLDPTAPGLNDWDHTMNAQAQSGAQDFWDHLALTRAQEYAEDDALALLPMDPVPASRPQQPALSQHSHATFVAQMPGFDPTQAPTAPPEQPVHISFVRSEPLSPPDLRASKLRRAPKSQGRTTGRFAYRMQRIWLTPLYRRAITQGLPLLLMAVAALGYLMDESRRAGLIAQGEALYALAVDRPEFMVSELRIGPVAPAIETEIRAVLEPALPQSSFRLDLDGLRAELERIDAIRLADLRLTADKALSVTITERVPAILWRSPEGLEVLDAEGVRIGFVTDRAALPDLWLIAGEGANRRVGEALDLIEAASPLHSRLRGLVHMGERRWDVMLDREQVIRLPETGAVAALERIIAYDQAQDLLARDILAADMRNPAQPVLHVSAGALETIRALRGTP
ncbi:MAG: cell division protein FtsQ/DivIB [Roseinatronobacter sp.]